MTPQAHAEYLPLSGERIAPSFGNSTVFALIWT